MRVASRSVLTLLLGLALPLSLPAQTERTDADYQQLGRKMTDWFFAGEADSLLAHMSPDGQQGAGGKNGILQFLANFLTRVGVETEIVEEKMTRRRGHPQYWRASHYTNFTGEPFVFRWVFDEAGAVIGVGTGPLSETPQPD